MKSVVAALTVAALSAWAHPAAALQVEGELQWARRVELSTPVSGVVDRIPAEVGERVEEGAALLYLDQRRLTAELEKAKAEVEGLKQRLAEAERELERAEDLYARTLLSNHDLQLAKIDYAAAKAKHAAARAALVEARVELEYSVIRAPFPAVVLAVGAERGQTVVSELEARTLVTVAESGRMIARVFVSEEQLEGVTEAQQAQVRLNGRRFAGRIERIGLEPAEETGAARYPLDVVFEYDPAAGLLRAGRKVEVELP